MLYDVEILSRIMVFCILFRGYMCCTFSFKPLKINNICHSTCFMIVN